jgi:hypothetical protein
VTTLEAEIVPQTVPFLSSAGWRRKRLRVYSPDLERYRAKPPTRDAPDPLIFPDPFPKEAMMPTESGSKAAAKFSP